MRSMKIPSRGREISNITHIECPYCKHKYLISEEIENDYEMVQNTKVHCCRQCHFEFINGITMDAQ